MMQVIPFKSEHALSLDVQTAQMGDKALFTPANLKGLEGPTGFSVLHEGKILAIFGWVTPYAGRALLWCVLGKAAPKHMIVLHRIAKELLKIIPHRRIEAEVAADFPAALRWVEMLGLECETPNPLRAYRCDGGDAYLYAKVN